MKERIKVLEISPGVPPLIGGVEKCTYMVYKYLNKRIFNLDVLVGKNKIYNKSKLPLIQCPINGTPYNYIIAFIKFLNAIKNVSIIHFQYPNFLFPNITYGLILLLACKILKKPYIIHIHLFLQFQSKFWQKLTIFYNIYFKTLLRNAKSIFIPTDYSKKLLIKQLNVDPSKIIILPNGIDNYFFELKQLEENKISKIIYIGRFAKVKNIDKLILAVKKIQENVYLYIYGSGEEEMNLKKIANGRENIIFKGKLHQNEIYKAYQGAKLMVLPSSNEELPISILEALASGVPVLCTKLPSVKSHFKNKIFYTDGSIDDLSNQIRIILHQDLTQKISEGRQFAERFRWAKIVSDIQRYYLKLLISK